MTLETAPVLPLELAAEIRSVCTGEVVWRVCTPDGKRILMSMDGRRRAHPEEAMREWFWNFAERYPNQIEDHGYEVQSARVFSKVETLALRAAEILERLAPGSTSDAGPMVSLPAAP